MFNGRYGLTEAVLSGRKTQTRRIASKFIPDAIQIGFNRLEIFNGIELRCYNDAGTFIKYKLPYQVGEVVAVAQSYKDIACGALWDDLKEAYKTEPTKLAGWNNKLFVRADLMPHQIRITNVRVEQLQDISNPDCLSEGVLDESQYYTKNDYPFGFYFSNTKLASLFFKKPQEAYAWLINKVCKKGTWESNPYVFVYDFERLIK